MNIINILQVFIDKDYDNNEMEYINNNFYVTPCYAIENFIVVISALNGF